MTFRLLKSIPIITTLFVASIYLESDTILVQEAEKTNKPGQVLFNKTFGKKVLARDLSKFKGTWLTPLYSYTSNGKQKLIGTQPVVVQTNSDNELVVGFLNWDRSNGRFKASQITYSVRRWQNTFLLTGAKEFESDKRLYKLELNAKLGQLAFYKTDFDFLYRALEKESISAEKLLDTKRPNVIRIRVDEKWANFFYAENKNCFESKPYLLCASVQSDELAELFGDRW